MKKLRNIFIILIFVLVLIASKNVFAQGVTKIRPVEFTKEYVAWAKLPEKERNKLSQPRMFDLPKTTIKYSNPLRFARMVGTDYEPKFDLRDKIKININDQGNTKLCWAFSSLSSLETNLLLRDVALKIEPVEYNFSAKHMDYATTYNFNESATNKYGINKAIASKGNGDIALSYLTNGLGAISEDDLEFDYTVNDVNIEDILHNDVISQVYETIDFESMDVNNPQLGDLQRQMKDHIMNYGSIYADIHEDLSDTQTYKKENAALYSYDSENHKMNHAVSIIGWDDGFKADKFANKPVRVNGDQTEDIDGAWIIRNSHGVSTQSFEDLDEFKEYIFDTLKDDADFQAKGYEDAQDIPDEEAKAMATAAGVITNEDETMYFPLGDSGIMYVSYADINIYKSLMGIVRADSKTNYDKIYQYNETMLYNGLIESAYTDSVKIASIFNRGGNDEDIQDDEYLTQVSVFIPEKCTVSVYINPNGETFDNLEQQVLINGSKTKAVDTAGYQTLEFKTPVKLNSEKYAVVLEMKGTRQLDILNDNDEPTGEKENVLYIAIESNYTEVDENKSENKDLMLFFKDLYKNIQNNSGKCFINFGDTQWKDIMSLEAVNGAKSPYKGDLTIKAFTKFGEIEKEEKSIKITKLPTVLSEEGKEFYVGDELDLEGMEVTAYYNEEKTDFDVLEEDEYVVSENYLSLAKGENTIIVTSLDGHTDNFKVTAKEKTNPDPETKVVKSIEATIDLTKEFFEHDDIELNEIEVIAYYDEEETDFDVLTDSDYTISENSKDLQKGENTITITYVKNPEITTELTVTAKERPATTKTVTNLAIKKYPDGYPEYIEGDNIEGLVLEATYDDGTKEDIDSTKYTVKDEEDKDLQEGQTSVTVYYGEADPIILTISVSKKVLQGIEITKDPKQKTYTEGDSFNPDEMEVTANYQLGRKEIIDEAEDEEEDGYTIENGTNLKAGPQKVTIKYKGQKATIDITVNPKTTQPDEKEAKISEFKNSTQNIKEIRAYYYTDTTKKPYVQIDAQIENIEKAEGNDKYEYYYYLSPKKDEQGISNWVKIENAKIENGKLIFTVDTRNIPNFEEVSDSTSLYLYVKEAVQKDDSKKSVEVTWSEIKLQGSNFKTYENDKLKDTIKPESDKDQSVAPIILPNTGVKIAIVFALILLSFATIKFIKYRKLKGI